MNPEQMTIKELQAIPLIEDGWKSKIEFTQFIVLPTRRLHDSGFGTMEFILLNKRKIVGRIAAGTDSVHLSELDNTWNFDCLPKSRALRFWCNKTLVYTYAGSDWTVEIKGEQK